MLLEHPDLDLTAAQRQDHPVLLPLGAQLPGAHTGVVATSSGNPRPRHSSSPFQPQPAPVIEAYLVDDRVSHDSDGLGRVVGLDAGGVTVDFMGKTVWITTPFRKMTKL